MENGNFNCRYRKKIIVVDQSYNFEIVITNLFLKFWI
jgi:hypothetical protein